MPAHCSELIAPVPESVSRSMRTSSPRSANRFSPASASAVSRSSRVVMRIGSTEWMRNGSMIVRNPSTVRTLTCGSVIEGLVEQIEQRHAELERLMGDQEVLGDRRRAAEVGREYQQMGVAAKLAAEWRRARDDEEGFQELLDEGEEVREELAAARTERERLEEEIRLAMVERDPNDDKNVIVEIQGGAGGEEAGLWARDVYEMLTKYAERKKFKPEPMEVGDG